MDRKRIVVDTAEGDVLEASLRGRVHRGRGRAKSPVAVGDHVTIDRLDDGGVAIAGVEPRSSVLMRPEAAGRWRDQVLVANADRAVLVFAHADPLPHSGLVDRMLVACHAGDVHPLLVFNKLDLETEPETTELIALYEGLGYELLRTCAQSGEGVDLLREVVRDRCSVFAGPSGTGKSSLINRVLPGVELRTSEISSTTHKGRHTTTAACLVRIPGESGHVIDTPGVREFGMTGIEPTEVALHFPEFPVPNQCRFLDCQHGSEPGCAVTQALADGAVARTRYGSYQAFRKELEERRKRY